MKGISVTNGQPGRRDFFWLDSGFGMMGSSPKRGLGFNLRFGGIFTSPPVAVAAMARQPLVVGGGVLATDIEPASGGLDPARPGRRATEHSGDVLVMDPDPAAADEGEGAALRRPGVFDDIFGGVRPVTHRLDLFGLGLDYAMYHKRFWGEHDTNNLGAWHSLGGIFVSAPAAIARGERVDVFGLGTDHALFTKSITGARWTPDWQRLGGAFTSTPSVISRSPTTIDLFIRGADFTVRANRLEGGEWLGWQNLGGNLASPPAVASWGPDRIDVFATFNDGTLRHRWWDGRIWNDWESLGGNYIGEPAVASWGEGRIDVFVVGASDRKLYHYWHEGQTWSQPEVMNIGTQQGTAETPAILAPEFNRLEVFVPTVDGQIRILRWDGASWSPMSAGAPMRLPNRYRFSVDYVKAVTTRALNADTNAAAATVSPGNVKPMIRTQWIGELGGVSNPKTAQTNLLDFEGVTVDLAEPMSFSYLVVNNGHAPKEKILAALGSASDSLSLSGSTSMQEQIGQNIAKFLEVKLMAAIAISVPVIGSILAKAESWLLGKLTDAIFESCDGVVAVEMRAMLGRDLFILTENGRKTVRMTTRHRGTDSGTFCGANSEYDVTWSIKPL